ncbi:MAG TPA: SOS response-associated peptidase [Gordonia sp. (in: high G+C Gram-positive bacteria)]|uniref:SOS response-associated peptidase n=1 Tax=unclassified Gordonia (in: high G+C Gram-positive bacteria) TaxID=2657482 RepID=UPI000F96E811|nr:MULTISPECIES: SOS response-associated peptidase [unclassified Gordonia (in: high G+C Gram-positive bacteria)]RUP39131.1 MAG: SOS response-associated peptidase [Gordonia sp. (in: high G+C Gram-positive bacteria)]HNP56141.1 SOS response-associated peptidase [Gordonia sp. (in: high G+C Gram-positive bacteria)]HRC50602.1 SOS response-associated peptidase [Gordonia sp. (in: high G+C Gram-positive bacteria)]
MCGRYAVTTDPAKLAAEIDAVNEVPVTLEKDWENYNVAPTTTILTVVERHAREDPDSEATRRIRAMRWGLIPPWAKEIGKSSLFNARAETAAEKASFRAAVKNKRCLVPMDGWYEWRKAVDDDGKAIKVPYFMSPADGTRLFMGGLWSAWRAKDGAPDDPPLLSCTILTTDAVGPLQQVHDRMPLIMPVQWWEQWLDPDAPASPALLAPPALELAQAIEIREVAPLVNRVANNGPQLLDPVS